MSETDWTFEGLWPYEPRWFETGRGRLHYVDEGPPDGRPVLLVHGNPTWSFIYRAAIERLTAAGHRAIAVDHLGFGRSDKPDDAAAYAVPEHARRFAEFADSLDLSDAVVVGHDWGGPIGFDWAGRNPDRVAGLFVLNTFAHRPPAKVPLPVPIKLFRAPVLGEILVKGLAAFHRGFLFHAGVTHPERMRGAVRRAYMAPHPTWSSRTAVLAFPRQIPAGPEGEISDLAAGIEQRLERSFGDDQVRVFWGADDIAFTEEMLQSFWLKSFPGARVERVADAGHYLQEDQPGRFAAAVTEFADSLIADSLSTWTSTISPSA